MDIAEETIRESEKRFRDIFGAVNDGILIIDPGEYRIVETNQKASELLGYDEEELVRDAHRKNPSERNGSTQENPGRRYAGPTRSDR